jgi:hypothetical protein
MIPSLPIKGLASMRLVRLLLYSAHQSSILFISMLALRLVAKLSLTSQWMKGADGKVSLLEKRTRRWALRTK